jgi:hypothetical protein
VIKVGFKNTKKFPEEGDIEIVIFRKKVTQTVVRACRRIWRLILEQCGLLIQSLENLKSNT